MVALVIAALMLTGCTGSPGIAIRAPAWEATVSIMPWPPAGVAPHEFVVAFTRGQPSPPVVLQMDMPEMSHAGARVPLHATAPGRYEGRAAFEMAGTWQLTLVAGDPPQRGKASVTVSP
jgi:hypothetical protein